MGLKRIVTVKQALQHVATNPTMPTDVLLDIPVHELVCRILFDAANNVQTNRPSHLNRANTARKMIFSRLAGSRKAGSHPATATRVVLNFVPLAGELDD